MTAPAPTINVAKDTANVGVQAGIVHEVTIYQVSANATPREKFEAAVMYLDNGMPGKARELIDEATSGGYWTSEVRFHQLVALLSGRTLQQLSDTDFMRLETAREHDTFEDDAWADGIKMIDRLLASIAATNGDQPIGLVELDKIGKDQSKKIIRHLEMFLKGPLEDQVWQRASNEARENQELSDRKARTWKFFEPAPTAPRMVLPEPMSSTTGVRIRAIAATSAFALAVGYIGVVLAQRGHWPADIAYVASIGGGYLWASRGLEWRFRNQRLRAKQREYLLPRQRQASVSGGFAGQVDRLFSKYFWRYAPDNIDRTTWLTETAGLRRSIRNELVTSFRDSPVDSRSIAWLVRYRVGLVSQQWQRGTLWSYERRYRTPIGTKCAAVASACVVAVAGLIALIGAVVLSPPHVAIATIVALVSGCIATIGWLGILVDGRRYADELDANKELFAGSTAAYKRWRDKLADAPSDSEMAAWLDCDRRLLMEEALTQYKLLPSNMIAHAFIEAPAPGCDRARVLNGPWRFSKYRLLVFLLTKDGVRQLAVDLDFHAISFGNRRRTSYRFDAVASVHVTEGACDERTFELELVSGYSLEIPVTGTGEEELGTGETSGTVVDLTVDAAGLGNTLHILEGIAAEGKDWIKHEDQRSGERINRLRQAVRGFVD